VPRSKGLLTVRTRFESLGRTEDGYTLIELLVVVLIIGILAAIAVPSFLNQKTKAVDASAKELAHSAQMAAESYSTDNGGGYVGLSPAVLNQYEATIQTASGNGNAWVTGASGTATGFTITTSAVGGAETFKITRSNGTTTRTCTPTSGVQGGCVSGSW
jgi:type IV pilus assembly protein PilA